MQTLTKSRQKQPDSNSVLAIQARTQELALEYINNVLQLLEPQGFNESDDIC